MSSIDPLAFGRGLEVGQQFIQPTDPLKIQQARIALQDQQAQVLERQANAQKLIQANAELRTKYNEGQAVQQLIATKNQLGQPLSVDDFMSTAPMNGGAWAKEYFTNLEASHKVQADQLEQQQKRAAKVQDDLDAIAESQREMAALPPEERFGKIPQVVQSLGQAGHLTPDQMTAFLDPKHWTDDELQQDITLNHKAAAAQIAEKRSQIEDALKQSQASQANAASLKDAADAALATSKKNRVDQGLPESPGEFDQKLAAYNANAAAVAKYGTGPEGMRKRDMAEGLSNDLMKVTSEAAARVAAENTTDNAALAGVSPKERPKVIDKKEKIDETYDGALNGNEEITRAIDQANAGNKEAQAALPMMMVNKLNALSGIKRANAAEFNRLGTAGSLLDSLQGKIGQITSGRPIPADILKDAKSMFDQLAANGADARNRAYSTLDTNYGSKFAGGASGKTVRMVAPNGQEKDVSPDQVDHYKSLGAKVKQ